jgi:hypothetical protein
MADLHTCLSALGRELAATSRELLAKQMDFSERSLCAAACEALQRQPDRRLVAVNEAPYAPRAGHGARADLEIFYGETEASPLWVEVKPMLEGWNYWNYSKFFNGKADKEQPDNSDSVILNDIDKMAYAITEHSRDPWTFAFFLILWTDGKALVPDATPVRPRGQLTPGQVLLLAERRFGRWTGRAPARLVVPVADDTVVVGLSQEWLNAKPANTVAGSPSKKRRSSCPR